MNRKNRRDHKPETHEDRFNPVELEDAMIKYSREPFRKALMDYLQGNPKVDEIRAFAKKYPDRHAQSCSIFARLAGYSEKVQVDIENNIHLWIKNASDLELQAKNAQLEQELAELKGKSIDVTPSNMPIKETDQMMVVEVQGKKSTK